MNAKTYGYHMVYEAPKLRYEAVVDVECECPVCKKKEGIKVTAGYAAERTLQNTYECQRCGSIWKGNYYDEGWQPRKGKVLNVAYKEALLFIAYILGGILIGKADVFLAIALVIINFILGSAFGFAAAIDSVKESKKRNGRLSRSFYIGNILLVIALVAF